MTTQERKRAYRRGRLAEGLAAAWLFLKGYQIVMHGFRVPQGEIDLIARKGDTLVLVEVKARRQDADARAAIGPRQQRRIERATGAFLQRYPKYSGLNLRFDVIVIIPLRPPRHIIDAWRPASGGSN